MRQLPEHGPRQRCDGWMWRNFHEIRQRERRTLVVRRDQSDNWQHSLSTVGFNNLSPTTLHSPRRFHWSIAPYSVEENRARILPEIMARLDESRIHLAQHRQGKCRLLILPVRLPRPVSSPIGARVPAPGR